MGVVTKPQTAEISAYERLQELSIDLFINFSGSAMYNDPPVSVRLNTRADLRVLDHLGSTGQEYTIKPYNVPREQRPKLRGEYLLRGLHILELEASEEPRGVYGIFLNVEDRRYEAVLLGRGLLNAIATERFDMAPIFPEE